MMWYNAKLKVESDYTMMAEMAEYYRAMLMVGLGDGFYQAFDRALEEENPLSDLTLSLCTCISDETEVLHILREYTLNYALDEQLVCDLILKDLRGRYQAGKITRSEVVEVLYSIVMNLDKFWEEPWHSLTEPSYDLELWVDGLICEDAFNQCFDAWFFCGKNLDAWKIQREINAKNR